MRSRPTGQMFHPTVVANVAPRSSLPLKRPVSLTHSSVFLRILPADGIEYAKR